MPVLPVWGWYILVVVAFELLADVLAKEFGLHGAGPLAVLALVGYVAANAAWLASLRSGAELSRGAVLFSVLSALGATLIGLFIYHEKAGTTQLVGLALGIVAVAFLSM